MEPLDPNSVDRLAEFVQIAAAHRAAGQIARASDFPKVKDTLAELRERLECRLLTLASDLNETVH